MAQAVVIQVDEAEYSAGLQEWQQVLDNGAGMEAAQAYGPLYSELPRDVAQRTLRFWKVRRDSGDV